ncbi:MAG: FAD-dependent oxidoreductase, partial [Syntrophales bacterium]|nr:FAD-dependent oxidoreductase [Syntrophales bacterium]
GKFEEIRMCTACCNCWDDIGAGRIMTCSVNARASREGVTVITPSAKPKKVSIIGGGPGGMEAARVAALRGHKVTLYEKSGELGGQLILAGLPPYKEEWKTTIVYFKSQMKKLKINVKLHSEFTLKTLEKEKPDALIVATGSVPVKPKIKGIDNENVVMAEDVLTGKKETGKKVIMIGGGLVGCETAEFLHKKGKQVTIVEMLPKIANDVGPWSRWPMMDRFEEEKMGMEVNVKVEEITGDGVKATRDGKDLFFPADSVVVAVGMKSEDTLLKQVEGKVPELYKVGTCAGPGKVVNVIYDGFMAGFTV